MVAATKSTSLRDSLFTPEALGQVPLPPSERDFQVFELVAIDGASTRQAAAEFGVSQSRIVQIRRHVAEWMGAEVPPTPRLTPIQRLRVAAEIAERRADHLYSQAMEGWRASQQPQTSICRGSLGNETQTTRERNGECRYLLAAMRITERQMHLAGTIRKVMSDAEDGSRFNVQGSKSGEQDADVGGEDAENPPVRACSHNEAVAANGHPAALASVDATDCQDEVSSELENRRREFLAALHNDAAPVHSLLADAGGMLLDSSEMQPINSHASTTALLDQPVAAPARPLSRKERRARQRLLERKLRKAK